MALNSVTNAAAWASRWMNDTSLAGEIQWCEALQFTLPIALPAALLSGEPPRPAGGLPAGLLDQGLLLARKARRSARRGSSPSPPKTCVISLRQDRAVTCPVFISVRRAARATSSLWAARTCCCCCRRRLRRRDSPLGSERAAPQGGARLGDGTLPRQLTMSLPAKRCGRPPVLSCLEKKKRKQSLDRRRGKTRIYVGNHIDRWLTLKEKLDFRNDAEVAGFLLDLYDNYDPLSKASICSLPEDVRRITVKGERELPDDTSLIAADGTYDNDDQLSKESTCSGPEDVRIITVKEERDLPDDCSTETDDTAVFLEATTPSVDSTDFFYCNTNSN